MGVEREKQPTETSRRELFDPLLKLLKRDPSEKLGNPPERAGLPFGRRSFLAGSAALASAGFLSYFTGCSKDEVSAPVIPEKADVVRNYANIRSWKKLTQKYPTLDATLEGVKTGDVNLGEALLYIAKDSVQYGMTEDFDFDECVAEINKIIHEAPKPSQYDTDYNNLDNLSRFFFKKLDFSFAMENSLDDDRTLNETVFQRKGVCEDLTGLFMLVARGVGFDLHAVDIPGHVFPRYHGKYGIMNVETTENGWLLNDQHYISNWDISQEDIDDGVYMRDLSDSEFVAATLTNRSKSFENINPEAEQADLDRAVSLAPNLLYSIGCRAGFFKKKKQWSRVLDDRRECARISPHNETLDYLVDDAQRELKLQQNSFAHIKEMTVKLRENPDDYLARRSRGWDYNNVGKYPEAILDLSQVVEMTKDTEKMQEIFGSGFNEGFFEDMRWRLLEDMADCYIQVGDYDSAIDSYDQRLEIKDFALTVHNRGKAYLAKADALKGAGKDVEASASYQSAIDDFSNNDVMGWSEHSALLGRGKALYGLGRFDEALTDLLKPEGSIGRDYVAERTYYTGLCYVKRGELEKAVGMMEIAKDHSSDRKYNIAYYRLKGLTLKKPEQDVFIPENP